MSEDRPVARHRSFSSEFKRQLAREFLDGRAGMHELARRYSLSRNLIRLWVRKYERPVSGGGWSEPGEAIGAPLFRADSIVDYE
jgi:transposase-like protein